MSQDVPELHSRSQASKLRVPSATRTPATAQARPGGTSGDPQADSHRPDVEYVFIRSFQQGDIVKSSSGVGVDQDTVCF